MRPLRFTSVVRASRPRHTAVRACSEDLSRRCLLRRPRTWPEGERPEGELAELLAPERVP